jgi:transcription initiation factor TFIID subunit 5
VRIFANHNGPVTAIAVNPDGRTMASAGVDKVIRLWDMGTGRIIKTMSGHTNSIHSLEFSRNGSLLASGAEDDSVRLWDVKKSNLDSIEMPSQVNRHIESQVKKYID